MDDEVRTVANALGLDTLKAAAYGMAFSGDGFMESFVLHTPGADHGIVPLVAMPTYTPHALPFAPASTFYFEEASVDLAGLLAGLRRGAPDVGRDFAEGLEDVLGEVNEALGVDVEGEVLAGLAGPMGFYAAMPETGGIFPEVALFLKVRDPKGYATVFERLARGIAGVVTEEGDVIAAPRTLAYRDRTLHLFEMQWAYGDDPFPFTPTWVLMDDWLVLTLVPHTMKEIVLRTSDPAARTRELEEEMRSYSSPFLTAEAFGVEDIIDPRETRAYLCQFVDAMQERLEEGLGPKMKSGVRP